MRKKILLLFVGIALAISSQAQFILIEHLHCHGDSNAVLSIVPNWGQAPYSFLWNIGDTTQTIHNLPTGNYTCTITDDNSFDSTLTYFVTEPSAITLVVDLITPSHCDGFNNGAVAISVSGGLSPYTFLWREVHFDSTYFTEDISGIRGGILAVGMIILVGLLVVTQLLQRL